MRKFHSKMIIQVHLVFHKNFFSDSGIRTHDLLTCVFMPGIFIFPIVDLPLIACHWHLGDLAEVTKTTDWQADP